jgi:hypothetical protein
MTASKECRNTRQKVQTLFNHYGNKVVLNYVSHSILPSGYDDVGDNDYCIHLKLYEPFCILFRLYLLFNFLRGAMHQLLAAGKQY